MLKPPRVLNHWHWWKGPRDPDDRADICQTGPRAYLVWLPASDAIIATAKTREALETTLLKLGYRSRVWGKR